MSRILRYSVLLILLCVTVVAHAGPGEDYRAARNSYQQLLTSPSKQQYRHHWDKVFSKLQRYVERYPSHNKAPSAYYLLGQSYEKLYEISRAKKDARTAVDYYQRLARRYPSSSLADDALLYSARLQCTSLGEDQGARTDCEAIMLRYNKGDMRSEAKSLLQRLPKAAAIKKPAAISRTTARSTVQAPARFAGIRVDKIRHSTDSDHTRVVIELNQLPTYTVNTLPSSQKNNTSARLYVDLYQTKINKSLPITQKPAQGIVRKIRIGVNSKTTRVVCDLDKLTRYKVVALDNPPRIVIDFARHQGAVFRSNRPQLEVTPTIIAKDISSVLQQVPADQPLRVRLPDVAGKSRGRLRIVVDAGHGGKDPGAVGRGKLYEKDVVLKLTKKLASRLRTKLGCEVLMTRDRDIYIPLLQRTAYANEVDADLFISIHANASKNKKAHGVETYYLNFSKNDKAVAVVARENGMSMQEVGDLELILFDLMANAKINESSRLAAEIQTSLIDKLSRKYSNVKDLGVKQGPFHVLLGATMPSVLVEVAFISNSMEAKRLNSSTYHDRTAEAIVDGVQKYLQSQNMLAKRPAGQ